MTFTIKQFYFVLLFILGNETLEFLPQLVYFSPVANHVGLELLLGSPSSGILVQNRLRIDEAQFESVLSLGGRGQNQDHQNQARAMGACFWSGQHL